MSDQSTIVLQGKSGIVLDGRSGLRPRSIQLKGCTDCTVSAFDLDNGMIRLDHCNNCTITGNTIRNCTTTPAAIFATGGTGNRYLRNRILGSGKDVRGLWIGNANNDPEINPEITGNHIEGTSATALALIANGALVTHNRCLRCGSGMAISAATKDRTSRTIITSNFCIGNKDHGIQSDAMPGAHTEEVICSGNVCAENGSIGIAVWNARDWVIDGNLVIDNGFRGIAISDSAKRIQVVGNKCYDTREAKKQTSGISIIAAVGKLDTQDIQLVGNDCHDNSQFGIQIVNAAPGTLAGVLLSGNFANNNGLHGIFVEDATAGDVADITLFGNYAKGNKKSDIHCGMKVVADGNHCGTFTGMGAPDR